MSIPTHFEDVAHSTVSPHDTYAEKYSPIWACMLAGGFGGAVGDSIMHSLDTVKTRQQGAPNYIPYKKMISAYRTILFKEGVFRGLYGGYGAAMLGSFPSAAMFFGTYETVKRLMIDDLGINDTLTHLTAGFLGDFASSIVYVPSEVLKTRLQLQGRYNNPHFKSGYNYMNLRDAIGTLVKQEGASTLFYGYKATLVRDLPFSAFQFAFYEKFRSWAFAYKGIDKQQDFDYNLELITGATAGGLAGILTTPLDVIKTRIQTQTPESGNGGLQLNNSILSSLRRVYVSEGIIGLFSGVGPRFVWTSVQSSIMLLLYQMALKKLDGW
jgi:hypothetical protein